MGGFHFALGLVLGLALAAPAVAGDGVTGKGDIELGPIPKYADEAEASSACGPDPVVWADSKTGFYYPKFFQDDGRTAHGAYTCYSKAQKADYWSLTPTADGHKGRQFPLIFCTQCS